MRKPVLSIVSEPSNAIQLGVNHRTQTAPPSDVVQQQHRRQQRNSRDPSPTTTTCSISSDAFHHHHDIHHKMRKQYSSGYNDFSSHYEESPETVDFGSSDTVDFGTATTTTTAPSTPPTTSPTAVSKAAAYYYKSNPSSRSSLSSGISNTSYHSRPIDNTRLTYVPVKLPCGVTTYCAPDVLSGCPMVLRSLETDLQNIFKLLPWSVHSFLLRTHIWVNASYEYGPRDDPVILRHSTAHHYEGWLMQV